MSVITWPAGLSVPASFTLGQQRYDMTESSDSSGADAARLLGPPRWTVSLRSVDIMTLAEAGLWEAMLLQLRGRVNHLAVYDPVRVAPQGSLRGAPTLDATAAAGATSIVLKDVRSQRNLLVYPSVVGAIAWIKSGGLTFTTDTAVAPDGTTTADTVTDPNATGASFAYQSVASPAASASYVASLYVRKTTGGTTPTLRLQVYFGGATAVSNSVGVNTDTGAILAGTGAVESVDATWWRVQVAGTNNASGNTEVQLRVYPAIDFYGGGGLNNAATGSATVWGAQLEAGSVASAYDPGSINAGDWLQIGTGVGTSQLVKAAAATTAAANGTLAVAIEPPLRRSFSASTAVTWDRPVAYYKQTSSPQWGYRARKSTGYALDLLESWTA